MYNSIKNNLLKDNTSINLAIKRTDYSKLRTRLSNQRTYLAYMRTGFVISAIGGAMTKGNIRITIFLFGLILIILSSIQYGIIIYDIENDNYHSIITDYVIFIFVILSLGILYFNYKKQIP